MDRVFIGVDPHKLSVTFEAQDSREILRATGQFGTDARGYRLLVQYARQWPDRIWVVEGANGVGRPLAQRLLASGSGYWTCPPSRRPGRGCSTPASQNELTGNCDRSPAAAGDDDHATPEPPICRAIRRRAIAGNRAPGCVSRACLC